MAVTRIKVDDRSRGTGIPYALRMKAFGQFLAPDGDLNYGGQMISGMTLGRKMEIASYKTSGFDYMRLILASGVIVQHSVNVSYGLDVATDMFHSEWRAIFAIILPMFFSLSGFLVAGSLFRCRSLVSFFSLRIIRLIPALACEVLLSAFIVGPLVTQFPLENYFSDHKFIVYFLNIIGFIHYELPGVFLYNPWPDIVNTQLWTIPYELKCYVALGLLALFGIVWKRQLLLIAMAAIQVALIAYVIIIHPPLTTLVSGRVLVFCFCWGIIFYSYRDSIKMNFSIFVSCALLTIFLLSVPGGDYLVSIPACYVTVYLGLQNPKKSKFLFAGDYSYGMYLYGFPIQQLFASISPITHSWYLSILVCIPAAFAAAKVSWMFIENPALRLKSRIPRFENMILGSIPQRLRGTILVN